MVNSLRLDYDLPVLDSLAEGNVNSPATSISLDCLFSPLTARLDPIWWIFAALTTVCISFLGERNETSTKVPVFSHQGYV